MIYYRTLVTEIGEEVPNLLDGGLLVLYAHGAPRALAEVSVQHEVQDEAIGYTPSVGASIQIGGLSTRISAIGETAWHKVRELGHVVLNFNGAGTAERPGEICVDPIDLVQVRSRMVRGCQIVVAS